MSHLCDVLCHQETWRQTWQQALKQKKTRTTLLNCMLVKCSSSVLLTAKGFDIPSEAGADLELNTWGGGHLVGVVSFNECGNAETKDF